MAAPASRSQPWIAAVVLSAVTAVAYLVGYLLDLPCRSTGWELAPMLENMCYSDIPKLFVERGLVDGIVPYLQTGPDGSYLEYPVLLGGFVWGASWIARTWGQANAGTDLRTLFFDLNVAFLLVPAIVTVLATAFTVRARRWDGLMVALAPAALLAGTINWDWIAVALTALTFLLWSRQRPALAGILLGLAISAKFYPLVLLVAFTLLAIRTGAWRPWCRLVVGAVVTWLAVNIPVALTSAEGWRTFYAFSRDRPADYGSPWFGITQSFGWSMPAEVLNRTATGAFLLLCGAIAALCLLAPRKPRLAQIALLVLVAFTLTNKVYSPQYVLWLIPLAVLARPSWRDFLIWQVGEVWYFVAVWSFTDWQMTGDGMTPTMYGVATAAHIGATLYLAGMVTRDVLLPEHDPVRSASGSTPIDDPGGGAFDRRDRHHRRRGANASEEPRSA